jgi:outer membrane lipoprotein carrier protein
MGILTEKVSANTNLQTLVNGIEKHYDVSNLSADFSQTATVKAMDIRDFASGKVYIKPPNRIRWEYETPEQNIFISNGYELWIYKPEDNQVMTGSASDFFGHGNKGANFLSDIRLIRKNFTISEEKKLNNKSVLKLVPRNRSADLSVVYITVLVRTFDIIKITTINSYGDETVIELSNVRFKQEIDDSLFNFKIPDNTEILQLNE